VGVCVSVHVLPRVALPALRGYERHHLVQAGALSRPEPRRGGQFSQISRSLFGTISLVTCLKLLRLRHARYQMTPKMTNYQLIITCAQLSFEASLPLAASVIMKCVSNVSAQI
jgi:hypothetical protein